MSKYEDAYFANMKFCIVFITGFIQFISCCDLNITRGSYSDCPYNLFRRKRAITTEYTRWRANVDTTPEFVVKVLDEDLTTVAPKQVIAVNIQPITKGTEKIIIGGAMVPKPAALSTSSEQINEYTRFVPPTTTVPTMKRGDEVYRGPVPVINQLSAIDKHIPLEPRGRHPQRDESPPAGPQFLPRTKLARHQYAPITPVGFTRHRTTTTLPPVTPSTPVPFTFETPQRTSIATLIVPTRTKGRTDDFRRYQGISTDMDEYITKQETTSETEFYLYITSLKSKPFEALVENEITDNKITDSKDNNKEESYNSMFYYDEIDKVNKKTRKGGIATSDDSYEDKIKDQDNTLTQETEGLEEKSSESSDKGHELSDNEEPEYKEIPIAADNFSDHASNYSNNDTAKDITLDTFRDKRGPICSMLKLRQLNFNSPRTLPEIVAQLGQWAEDSPVAKWVDITDGNLTTMENPIYMMIVDDPSSGQIISAKQTVMIVAGIQGRDQHAVAAAMYVLYQLIERSEAHTDLLTKYRFWVIPVFNPDGYDYAMTFPHRREWTKNLRQNWDVCKGRESCQSCEAYGLRCTIQPCYGVNLDRNFEYQWIPTEELRTEHPCGGLYAGARQLSETETRAFTNYLHQQKTPIYTFIAFKEGDVLGIMYPYSHTRKRRSFDHVYRQRAARAASAAYSISGRPYVAGQTSEFLPLYAGGIEDWIDGHLGIDNTYTIMMFRPADAFNNKLITERVVHEAYAAMDTLVLQSVEPLAVPPVRVAEAKGAAQTISIHAIVYFIYIIIQYFT